MLVLNYELGVCWFYLSMKFMLSLMVFFFKGAGFDRTLVVYSALDDYMQKRMERHKRKLNEEFNQRVDAKAWDIVVALLREKGIPLDDIPLYRQRHHPQAGPSSHGGGGGHSRQDGEEDGKTGHGGGKKE